MRDLRMRDLRIAGSCSSQCPCVLEFLEDFENEP
jgi:hypothetical protein